MAVILCFFIRGKREKHFFCQKKFSKKEKGQIFDKGEDKFSTGKRKKQKKKMA
jgi:hypothetical protein